MVATTGAGATFVTTVTWFGLGEVIALIALLVAAQVVRIRWS